MITLSIDVTKIEKTKLKEVTKRNGEVAKYLDLAQAGCAAEPGRAERWSATVLSFCTFT